MNSPLVGFYVHYHGLGHKHRTESILRHLTVPAAVVTSRLHRRLWRGPTLSQVVGIDCDIDDVPAAGMRRAADVNSLHYAPLWTAGCTRRVAQYAQWLDQYRPAVMIVDVSAEISMLTRLSAIPQIVMRQHGDRRDAAHLNAYAASESLLAPFPARMEDDLTPEWVADKTVYLDGFCRLGDPQPADPHRLRIQRSLPQDRPLVTVVLGRGGSDDVVPRLTAAARRASDYHWVVVGVDGEHDTPSNLQFSGWVDHPEDYMAAADVVVTAAGHNSVMEAGRVGTPFIAIGQQRPFDEQVRKAYVLQRERLAIGLAAWPSDNEWPAVLERARQLDTSDWKEIFARDGAKQAAQHIESIAISSWNENTRYFQNASAADTTLWSSEIRRFPNIGSNRTSPVATDGEPA